jgi:hypothetical protein
MPVIVPEKSARRSTVFGKSLLKYGTADGRQRFPADAPGRIACLGSFTKKVLVVFDPPFAGECVFFTLICSDARFPNPNPALV